MSEETKSSDSGCPGDRRHRRHRIGRRARLTLAAITLVGLGAVLGAAASVQAARMGGWHGGHHLGMVSTKEQALERALDGTAWVLGRVDASADQQTRINAIVTELVTELYPMRDAHVERRRQLITELARPQVDREALEAIRADGIASLDAASKSLVDAVLEASDVLDAEQREALAALIARHRP